MTKKVIIIGAGPAGLAAADKLCDYQIKPVILEKGSSAGGISRTIKYKRYYFDIGPHRFFTKNTSVFNWWQAVLKEDLLKKPRYTRIYYKGTFFSYPISIANVLFNLRFFSALLIVFSYLKSRIFRHQKEDSLEKWVTNRFGRRLYQIFFKDYTEKLWGIPCAQISADWATQRIKGLSLSAAVRNAIFNDRNDSIKSLVKEFYYPRLGAGMMYEAVAQRIIHKGGDLRFNSEVIEIKHDYNTVKALVLSNTQSGSPLEIAGTDFCSSMPLNLLVSRMNPRPPLEVLESCQRLHYRSLILAYLILDCRDVFKDNWIYINSPEIKAGRIQNYKNWTQDMVPDPDKTSLGMEYFCNEEDAFWKQDDQMLLSLAAEELERLKIARTKDIFDGFILRVPKTYPVYDSGYYHALTAIKNYISRFSNLQCIGRAGMFRYNNMDHSVLTGFLAAQNILGAKEDLWNVNTERSYHEELRGAVWY